MENGLVLVYAIPLLVIMGWYFYRHVSTSQRSRAVQEEAKEAGLVEPASLHPVIDPAKCLGCGACVSACPEYPQHAVLGIIDGKAQLVSPTECIGHSACKAACPFDAISLVFGTATRGVDIPVLSPTFESTVPGLYIAGELGGMGLIRNALIQGCQAMEAIAKNGRRAPGKQLLDVLIVGAGPAGMAGALTAKSLNLSYRVIEQESLGGCVFQYPRGKLVMTAPVELPLVGTFQFRQTSKEHLLGVWTDIVKQHELRLHCNERVEAIEAAEGGFTVRTTKAVYRAANVLLAIGRRGTPRKLGVPGEELSKVVYRLIDPEQYVGQKVLVVGGGDSALEAAASIAEMPGTHVTLSYRGEAFGRAKPKNRQRVNEGTERGNLKVLLSSNVKQIGADQVLLDQGGRPVPLANQAVIVSAGGVLPNEFLNKVGIRVETKYGTA
jgi:thioredoxin reductase (NADPH)